MTQPMSPCAQYLADFPEQTADVARLFTAGWVARDISNHLQVPYSAVAGAMDALPTNLVALLDSPQGVNLLADYFAQVVGSFAKPYKTSVH